MQASFIFVLFRVAKPYFHFKTPRCNPAKPCFQSERPFRNLRSPVSIFKRPFATQQNPVSISKPIFANRDSRFQNRLGLLWLIVSLQYLMMLCVILNLFFCC